MSLAGLKKQINKANQFVTEKIGGVEGTKLDDDYVAIEKKIDAMTKLFDDVLARTHEYLQPNPALRAKLMTMNTFNKIQGKSKNALYPLPEAQLGDCMIKYGQELEESTFGECLQKAGESFKYMSDVRYAMEDHVRDNYLVPIHSIQTHELKEIGHHRKKLEGRRLDFDCKKRKQDKALGGAGIPQDEIRIAEEKFQESKLLAETAMVNFLNSEVEHIQALTEFITAQMDYHRQAADIMEQLQKYLIEKKEEADGKPKAVHKPRPLNSLLSNSSSGHNDSSSTKNGFANSTSGLSDSTNIHGPCCRALYDFEAENETELPFKEGNMIKLLEAVDENWYMGEVNGKRGYFPVNYVEVVTPLP